MRKKIVSVLLTACLALSLAACGGTKDSSDSPKEEGSGGESAAVDITACIASEPETIDPSLNSSVDGATYVQHVFEGLMKFKTKEGSVDVDLVPGQAVAEPEISKDQLTYTFTLRDDILWSDGEPVTAENFVYSWQRIVDPATAADYGYIINMVENAMEIQAGEKDKSELGIKAIDEKTLEIKLVSPTPYFLELCAFSSLMPLREDVVAGNDQWTDGNYIGNGKYKIESWTHDDNIVMVKNEEYYDPEEVKTNSITWRLMDDTNAMLAEFKSGSLDFINSVPVNEVPTLKEEETIKFVPYIGTYGVVFNVNEKPFDNPLVREAFSLAIDRNYIVNQVTQMGQLPATGWVPNGITNYDNGEFRVDGGDYYSVAEADYEANCQKAKELLAKAGYPDGKGFPKVTYMYNTLEEHQKIYEAMQFMWQEVLNVSVSGSNQDWNVFLSTRESGEFQFCRHGWIADYNDAINFLDMWMTDQIGGNNYAQWSNKEYDQLIKDSILELDPTKRQELLHKAEDILMGESAVAPLYFYVEKYCLNDKLGGESHTPLGYWFLWNLEEQ
jgi:oligopeptide transport system substrate-binding protein